MTLEKLTISEAKAKLAAQEITVQELTEAVLNNIKQVDNKTKAFLYLAEKEALTQAKEADKLIQKGEDKPLLGIPLAIKDNICTKDIPTTCASKILDGFIPPYDATVISRLKEAGAIIIGKTNLDEFAMGSSTENSAFAKTANPWDLTKVPGGSSGGSAAAVAGAMALGALGSDTGGSIRQPAAFCGLVGMKPTYGLVSRYGLVAFASSLDQIGPLTKSVEDTAILLNCISGYDPSDSTSLNYNPPDYQASLRQSFNKLTVGVVKELSGEGIDPQVRGLFNQTLKLLENLGATIEEVSLPSLNYALPAYYLIAPAEASSNLARFDGVRYGYRSAKGEDIVESYKFTRAEGFGAEVKRRIMLGTYALSAGYYEAYYGQAQKVRTVIINEFKQAFSRFSLLASPTTPTPAFALGAKIADPLQMYLSDICTIPVNLAGLPAISLPCGLAAGLPVGFQLIAPHLSEPKLLAVAYALEQELGFKSSPPFKNE